MELDDLKARWQKETKENLNTNKQSMEQLQAILKEKTSGTLINIREKYKGIISYLMVGLLLNIIISPFLHFLLGDDGPVFRLTFSGLLSLVFLLTIGLLVVLFYWLRFSSFSTEVSDVDLHTALIEKITSLKRSFKQEIIFIAAVFLAIFIIGRASSQYLGHGDFGDIYRKDILLAIGAGLAILIFYISRRVKAYNKDIGTLKSYLAEFEGNNEQ